MTIKMKQSTPPGPLVVRYGLFDPHLYKLQHDPIGFAREIFSEYGSYTYVRFAMNRIYFINRPELIREILTTKMKSFRRLPKQMNALRKIEGDGLVVSEGAIWKRHRPVVQGIFHHNHFAHHGEVITQITQKRLERWQPNVTFDLCEEMNQLALLITAKLVFDIDLEKEAEQLRVAVHQFRDAMQAEVTNPFYWFEFGKRRRQRQAINEINELLWKLIRAHKADAVPKSDMLGMIITAARNLPADVPFTDDEIRDEVSTLFVAGHDTTSAALAWFWYCLASNPDVEKKVIQEIDEKLEGRLPTYADLPKLKYLELVVKESMRMYPAASFLFGRQAIEPVELGEFTLPKNAWVIMSPYIVHHDPSVYPEPEKFDPERFTAERIGEIPPYAYLPFGGGSRVCIGNSMAMMEIILLGAIVLQKYRIEFDPSQTSIELEVEVVLRPKGGLKMKAVPR
jgi:cytochrome P450